MFTSPGHITPCLWFDTQAHEAAEFYVGIFPNSQIKRIVDCPRSEHEFHRERAGTVLAVTFTLNGISMMALNGGPQFQFSEAISLQVSCQTQDDVDYYWDRLSAGGDPQAQQCGWLKDKYGVSWQVVPDAVQQMLGGDDPARSERVMNALLAMKKLDMAALEAAYVGN
ncbi:MAG: hypothetical protein CMJ58_21865 [Planctomycetaceae bacterium]|nr:hypothetical protein [Planctomycetaceae bacterium]